MSWRNRGRHWLEQYCKNVLYTLDMAMNTILLAGDPKETLSSRMAKRAADGRWLSKVGCRFLDLLDDGHCVNSLHLDRGDKQIWSSPWRSVVFGLVLVALFFTLLIWAC